MVIYLTPMDRWCRSVLILSTLFVSALPGDACTPELSLTARPGSLTVDLSRNHSLALEHGDHAKHRVYYGKEGELLQVRKLVSLASIQHAASSCFMCTVGDLRLHPRFIGVKMPCLTPVSSGHFCNDLLTDQNKCISFGQQTTKVSDWQC